MFLSEWTKYNYQSFGYLLQYCLGSYSSIMEYTRYPSSVLKPTIRLIRNGDVVITYERHDSIDYINLKINETTQNKFGLFHHDDFIGKPFGSKIFSRSSNRWIYALEPTPDLWTEALHVSILHQLVLTHNNDSNIFEPCLL